jgi:endoglucanase
MLLEKLSNARGVSGDESAVRELLAEHLKKYVDEYRVDALGNLIAVKHSRRARAARKVLIAAHMDEVGFLVTFIDAEGSLHFEKVGGFDDRTLLGNQVAIGANAVPGVIGYKPRHLSTEVERRKAITAEELCIDIGARSRQDAERVVMPGDFVSFATEFAAFGENCVRGKALDDRAGCAILAELVRETLPFDLYAAFTTQEEIGLRGARVAGYAVAPDVALVLEATVCDDSPKAREQSPTTRLGAGPALTIADRRLLADKRLVHHLEDTAREHRIPYQIKQPLIGSTDAGQLHLAREGVPSAVVSLPARYIHSPAAVISLDDFNNTLRLLRAALPALDNGLVNHA